MSLIIMVILNDFSSTGYCPMFLNDNDSYCIYTETKKKLSPSLNVDMLVQFFNPFETRFLR
jgi:hypothetical protein